jgi:hypothetical protein
MAIGQSALDDLDRLAHDKTFRLAVWDRPGDAVLDERVASQPTRSRSIGNLKSRGNRQVLRCGSLELVRRGVLASGDDRRGTRNGVSILP